VIDCPECATTLRVEPDGGGQSIEPREKGSNQLAFLPEKARDYFVIVSGTGGVAARPFTMRIRAWDESEPLPAKLRFPTPPLAGPTIAVRQQIKDKLLVGGAFAPSGTAFWTSNHDMTLTLWQYPLLVNKGTFKLRQRLYALGVDSRGRLYAQPGPADTGPPALAKRTVREIEIYDDLGPKGEADELPRPSAAILLNALIGRMVSSKDGRWIYFLDVQNGKLGRIDADKGTVSGSVDRLSEGTRAFCLTPDGKTIYCCADTGHLDVIDTAAFGLEHTVTLNRGKPFEIAATDRGVVFLLGQDVSDEKGGNCALVDLTRGIGAKAFVMPVPCKHHGQFLQMAPEQDAVFISGDRKITTCVIPPRPALHAAVCREFSLGNVPTPGWMQISPDGRTILHDSGSILSVTR
jgi:hypothetical protein